MEEWAKSEGRFAALRGLGFCDSDCAPVPVSAAVDQHLWRRIMGREPVGGVTSFAGDAMTLHEYCKANRRGRMCGRCLRDGLRASRHHAEPHRRERSDPAVPWLMPDARELATGLAALAAQCPDGDRFTVTDPGEGARALRLRTDVAAFAMELPIRSGSPAHWNRQVGAPSEGSRNSTTN